MKDYDIVNSQWKTQVIEDPKYPFVIVDNWYNSEEEKSVWKELEFYNSVPREKIHRAEKTVVARDIDTGDAKSKSYRHYISNIYSRDGEAYSTIQRCLYKGRSKQFHNLIEKTQPYGRSFISSNHDNSMVSYYEEDDHYDSHHDTTLWTACIWFVKEPRLFTGGDFDFPESGYEVKLKHNRAVFFPSCFLHRVSPVKFNTQPKEIGYGRYTITHFYYYLPTAVDL